MTAEGLPPTAFDRQDGSPDGDFYSQPRFVTHIDDAAIAEVTKLYRELFPNKGAILDLMSSWVSHLPPEVDYTRVVGVGMNSEELAANKQLDQWRVQDLNANPGLPFESGEFDAIGICVSIQYLTNPAEVLREASRVLKDGAPIVITFSNRCFPTKAVAVWQTLDDKGHGRLVEHYLRQAGNWQDIRTLDRSPRRFWGDPLYAVVARAYNKQQTREEKTT